MMKKFKYKLYFKRLRTVNLGNNDHGYNEVNL